MEAQLFANNLSLYNLGDINQQTIAGLIATGSHGTGLSFGIASTQITWIQLITADGRVVECSPTQHHELFKAAQVSLGTLGVISKVKIKVLPK
ncbi:FAD-binding protein [Legionella sp.]|uniref:FAD-binding protein n=1 Tax=Legionella sp. TaxID=459 RepID=UPI003D119DEC